MSQHKLDRRHIADLDEESTECSHCAKLALELEEAERKYEQLWEVHRDGVVERLTAGLAAERERAEEATGDRDCEREAHNRLTAETMRRFGECERERDQLAEALRAVSKARDAARHYSGRFKDGTNRDYVLGFEAALYLRDGYYFDCETGEPREGEDVVLIHETLTDAALSTTPPESKADSEMPQNGTADSQDTAEDDL